MAEDISIGADASQAIAEMRKLESAVVRSMEAAGASSKQLNTTSKQLERTFATVASVAVQSAQKTNAALKGEVASTQLAIKAAEDLARARAQATQKTGLKENSAGRVVNSSTGRFAGGDSAARYANEIALQQKLIANESALESQRAKSAQNQRARSAEYIKAEQMAADVYSRRQRELERSFKGGIVGLSAGEKGGAGVTQLQKLGNLLQQIPPATWEQRMRAASSSIMEMSNSTRYALYEVANTATVAGAAFIAFGALSVRAAISHERAFANVERTTQTSAQGYEALRRQLEQMSMELPVTYEELTNIAAAAGQLGIAASGVASFTRTVAQLTATTNLTSEAAGIALARFRTFFSESSTPGLAVTEATFSNLASSILKVGVNSIASETGIVNVATQIASMGDYAGLTANQVIGLAGALSSIGVAPELARGTITRTFSMIGNAVSDGGIQLEKFAALSGRSSAEFSAAWGTDQFAGVFTDLMGGIQDLATSGGDANLMLQELGFNSVRDRPLLLRLAGAADEAGVAGGLLAQTLSDAYEGWTRNSELALQYSKISTTTSARLQVLGQAFEQLAASMGEQTGGFLGEMATQLTAVIRGFEEFSNSDVGQVLGTIAIQGALALGALLLIVGGASRAAASIQAIGTAWGDMTKKAGTEGVTMATRIAGAFRIVQASLGIIGLVAGLATLIGSFVAVDSAARESRRAIQDVNSVVLSMRQSAEDGAQGVDFFVDRTGAAGAVSAEMAGQADRMTAALAGSAAGAMQGASGLDEMSASAEKLKFTFGEVERELVKSQLTDNEAFQNLFKMDTGFDWFNPNTMFDLETLKKNGLNPAQIDIDELIRVGADGGNIQKTVRDQLLAGLDQADFNAAQWSDMEAAANGYGVRAAEVFGGLNTVLFEAATQQAALEGQSKDTFAEIYDGAEQATGAVSELDEVTQKMVDGIAAGFAKFADTSSLIKLAQDFAGIQGAEDPTAAAAEYEKAWVDAYGGASFSLEQYLGVYRRAGGEQKSFIEDLSVLRERTSGLNVSSDFLNDLAAMGPEANRLVEALVAGTDEQLVEFEALWGQTGYDSMVMFATQAAIGQEVVNAVLRAGGLEGLRAFNESLASGVGVDQALAALQLDVNGKPITPAANTPVLPNLSAQEKAMWAANNRLATTARVTFVGSAAIRTNPTTGGHSVENIYANGGYTGPGSKYQPAGTVHAGEFVMTAEATRAIGVNNLYSMMRSAQGGRSAPRGRGYAQGGAVTGSSSSVVELSPRDRALFRGAASPRVIIGNRDIAQAVATANFSTKRQGA